MYWARLVGVSLARQPNEYGLRVILIRYCRKIGPIVGNGLHITSIIGVMESDVLIIITVLDGDEDFHIIIHQYHLNLIVP